LEKAVRGPKNEDYYLPNATEEDIKSILFITATKKDNSQKGERREGLCKRL